MKAQTPRHDNAGNLVRRTAVGSQEELSDYIKVLKKRENQQDLERAIKIKIKRKLKDMMVNSNDKKKRRETFFNSKTTS